MKAEEVQIPKRITQQLFGQIVEETVQTPKFAYQEAIVEG